MRRSLAIALTLAITTSAFASAGEADTRPSTHPSTHPSDHSQQHHSSTQPSHHPSTQPSTRHAGGEHDATMHHRFDDVDQWVKVFDNPERDAWQKPRALVDALAIANGAVVADIGAGTGYFEPYLAEAVGIDGTVFAVDVEANLIDHLRSRAEKDKTSNVIPILGSFDNPRLPTGQLDLILIVDTYHHIDDRLSYFMHLATRLKSGGRLVIVDLEKRESPVGPPLEHKLAKEKVLGELAQVGYSLLEDLDLLPHQYVLTFTPPK